MSVAHIIYPETMDETRTRPRDGGLNDPFLGTIDRSTKCKTCGQADSICPGHFGHIELAKPCYHPGFIKKVKKILEIVCHTCSKVLADRVSFSSPFSHSLFALRFCFQSQDAEEKMKMNGYKPCQNKKK